VAVNVQEIRNPELDGQLVSESIAQQLEKRIAPKRAIRQAIQRSMRMGAQGIRVLIAGRLGGAEMARREGGKDGRSRSTRCALISTTASPRRGRPMATSGSRSGSTAVTSCRTSGG